MNETYVIWDNTESAFVESVEVRRVYYTTDINSAYQYKNEEDAEDVRQILSDSVLLEWR